MDPQDPCWADFEQRFLELAASATLWQGAKPALDTMPAYLCLYGDNGMPADQELDLLEQLMQAPVSRLHKLEIEADYWQDTILFLTP